MKYSIHILITLISIFFIHIVLYFSLNDYRFFWEKLKNSDDIIYVDVENISIDDTLILNDSETISTTTPTEDILTNILELDDDISSSEVTKEVVL
jgi:hypothetical protein